MCRIIRCCIIFLRKTKKFRKCLFPNSLDSNKIGVEGLSYQKLHARLCPNFIICLGFFHLI